MLAALAGWLVLPLSFFYPSLPLLLTLLLGLFVCGMFVARDSCFRFKEKKRDSCFGTKLESVTGAVCLNFFLQNKQGFYFEIG